MDLPEESALTAFIIELRNTIKIPPTISIGGNVFDHMLS
jgi:hypothetical protein